MYLQEGGKSGMPRMRFRAWQPGNDVGHMHAHVKAVLHLQIEVNNTYAATALRDFRACFNLRSN